MTIFTALVTPFDAQGDLDLHRFEQLLQEQVAAQVSGVLLFGTTGEGPTLTEGERLTLLQIAKRYHAHMQIIVGCGSNCTRTTLRSIERAAAYGIDAVLIIAPYYNRPPMEGLRAHFETLAQNSPCPIIIYNHPGRTAVSLSVDLIAHLATYPTIRGIKECADFSRLIDLIVTMHSRSPHFRIYVGDELQALAGRIAGAHGFFSIAANLLPHEMVQFAHATYAEAAALQRQWWPLWRALFAESNPIPIKAACALMGKSVGAPRLPLTSLDAQQQDLLQQRLDEVLCSVR